MKACSKCKVEKEVEEFYKDTTKKDGLQGKCKVCVKAYRQSDKGKAYNKAYKQSNKGKAYNKAYNKAYRQSDKGKAYNKAYNQSDKGKAHGKAYQQSDKRKAYDKARNQSDKGKAYNQSDKRKAYNKAYSKVRKATDPLFKLRHNLRSLICLSLKNKGYKKNSKTQSLLGADFVTVSQHLIDSAIRNYGVYYPDRDYHIDHIIPCASARTEAELIALQHYTNLQYLYPEDNLSKRDKLDWEIKQRA